MKKIIYNLLRQFFFWLFFFALARALFLIYYSGLIIEDQMGFFHVIATFWHALKLDIATTCYILIFPFFLLLLQSLQSPKWLNVIHKVYTAILLFIYSLITTSEIGVYYEWKTKLHFKAFLYLSNPLEIYNSAETSKFFILIGILLVLFLVGFFFYLKVVYLPIVRFKRNIIFSFLFLLITPPLLLLGARGGIREIPINQSESYFSKHNFLNLAATNSAFNLYISFFENYKNFGVNPYHYFDDEIAKKIVSDIYYTPTDTTVNVLKTNNPNIVLLILESWSADLIESLGGEAGVTPAFHGMEKEGILFTNMYASGARSEQGMGSIFGGFPAHPISSITVQPDKYVHLPSLTRKLRDRGYFTSFSFGGQLIYGNIKSYIMSNEFDRVKEVYDFDDDLPRGKLGIHDEFTLDVLLHDITEDPQPFFSVLFTVSTHSPFDMPMDEKQDWGYNDDINNYLNSAYYTDQCLAGFMKEAKKQEWYENTLFIIVADHSHHSQKKWNFHSPEYHKIPMLFTGAVLKDEYRGTKHEKLGFQTDFSATLLAQLGVSADEFHWSKNLFNPYAPSFASVSFEEGIGWITPNGYFFYEDRIDRYYCKEFIPGTEEEEIKNGKAFLQVLFQEYMDY